VNKRVLYQDGFLTLSSEINAKMGKAVVNWTTEVLHNATPSKYLSITILPRRLSMTWPSELLFESAITFSTSIESDT
jgi:hypothetical protein